MKNDDVLKRLEKEFAEQAAPIATGADAKMAELVVAVQRDRLMLAETALSRVEKVTIDRSEPTVPQLYVAVRGGLRRDELAEWNRLAEALRRILNGSS